MEKEENAGNQHFLLFPKVFIPFKIENINLATIISSSVNTFNSEEAQILSFRKDLKQITIDLPQICLEYKDIFIFSREGEQRKYH